MNLKQILHSSKITTKSSIIILSGIICGLAAFIIYISNAPSYLSDEPATCVNCHIMAPQYATWAHSSHNQYTNCNDCHVPHNNVVNKYYFKAKDGMRHSTIFTLRAEPQVIFIKSEGKAVVQQNCLRCHEKLLTTDQRLMGMGYINNGQKRNCTDCHKHVPHGRVNSLSSTPFARVPLPVSPVPAWLKKQVKN